jgi:hypothetical protein
MMIQWVVEFFFDIGDRSLPIESCDRKLQQERTVREWRAQRNRWKNRHCKPWRRVKAFCIADFSQPTAVVLANYLPGIFARILLLLIGGFHSFWLWPGRRKNNWTFDSSTPFGLEESPHVTSYHQTRCGSAGNNNPDSDAGLFWLIA